MLVGVEVDAEHMSLVFLASYFAAGTVGGALYFHTLWWNTRLFAQAGRARTMILAMIGRFVLLGGLLTLASLAGAMPLLLTALGVFAARFVVMSKVRAS
jgi:F1F0 ATPase subunit 2